MNHGVQPTNMGRISRLGFCAGTVCNRADGYFQVQYSALYFWYVAVQESIPN